MKIEEKGRRIGGIGTQGISTVSDGKKRKVSTTRLSLSLPIDVLTSILSRLPVKSILRFYIVCKEWHDLLHHRDFINAHKARSKLLERKLFPNLTFGRMWLRPLPWWRDHFLILGSIEGLVFIQDRDGRYHVCNPATRLTLALPVSADQSEDPTHYKASGFHSAMHLNPSTGEIKLARLHLHMHSTCGCCCTHSTCEILTLGESGSAAGSRRLAHAWKVVGSFPNPDEGRILSLFKKDGAVYWVFTRGSKRDGFSVDVAILDWEKERFTMLTSPRGLSTIDSLNHVFVWDDCLAIGHITDAKLIVWILEEDECCGNMKQTWRLEVVPMPFLGSPGASEKKWLRPERKDKDIIMLSTLNDIYYLYDTVSMNFTRCYRNDSTSHPDHLFYMPTLESCCGMVPAVQYSIYSWFAHLLQKLFLHN